MVMIRSGLCWDKNCVGGLGFWGANGHDAIWHIALIESLTKGVWSSPIFAGAGLQNYHIGYDLLMSWLVRLTGISASVLYFQVVPVVLSLGVGLLTYRFIENWKNSKTAAWWGTFFIYFGGSWGWLVSILRGEGWGGESMFWSQQSISTLINPPFALSLVVIFTGLIFLNKYLTRKSWINFVIASLFFGITIFIKVYAGLLILTALFVGGVWNVIKIRSFRMLGIFFASFVLSTILFIPFNKTSVSLVSVSPFWFLETMVGLSDRFYWPKLFSAMTTYKMGHLWLKAFISYFFAFIIFIIGNFGTRIILFGIFFNKLKKLISADVLSIMLSILVLSGIIVPLFFVQEGTPWNTIQFFYYSLIFSGIGAGIFLSHLFEKRKSLIIKTIIVVLTIPTTIASLTNYLPRNPQSILPADEFVALKFLSDQPEGVVLTYPYDSIKAGLAIAPRPLYLYTSTSYVSAFSKHPVFLEDETNLDIMQYPWIERRKGIEEFYNTLDLDAAYKYLRSNNIKYVYWLKDQHARIGDKQLDMTKIFQQGDVVIFRVNYL